MSSLVCSYADAFPLDGGCACGNIRYRLHRAPLVVHCCHCTACQRETGGAFAINAVIETEHVELLSSAAPYVPGPKADADGKPAGPALVKSPFSAADTKDDSSSSSSPLPLVCVPTPTESQAPQLISRCPLCATAVWSAYGPSAPLDLVRYVRAGTLDRPWAVAPDAHIFVASKRDFVALADGKPQFQGLYPAKDVYRQDSMDRLTALMEKIKVTAQEGGQQKEGKTADNDKEEK